METSSSRSTEFPPSTTATAHDAHHSTMKHPAPAGQTPPCQDRVVPNHSVFVPSPIECASPTTGTLYHPATPMPTNTLFHDTPASPVPTFVVNQQPQASPMLCGPTPTSTPVPVHSSFPHSPQPVTMEFATETPYAPQANTNTLPNPTNSPSGSAPHLSTIKGNFTSFVGKVTHNPDKQQAGNAMIASRKEEKAAVLDQKAADWEAKGNTAKAQKNREKASRYRQMAQAKLNEPLTTPPNKTAAKTDKAARLDAKAQEYERKGDQARATKTHEKAYQLRQKHKLSQPIGGTNPTVAATPIAPSI